MRHAKRKQIALHTINALLAIQVMATAACTVTPATIASGWILLTATNARVARPVIRATARLKLLTGVLLLRRTIRTRLRLAALWAGLTTTLR